MPAKASSQGWIWSKKPNRGGFPAAVLAVWAACLWAPAIPGAHARDGNWAALKGTLDFGVGAIYGTQGVADAKNRPGVRGGSASWTGPDGALCLFGGVGYDKAGAEGLLNDAWRYDGAPNRWTWLKGSSVRNAAGTYGTLGTPAPGNNPGGRRYAAGWTDTDGSFYVFGGEGYPEAYQTPGWLSDLWKFDPAANQWTWVKGSKLANQSGTYGTQGTPAPANSPGARWGAVSWRSSDGALYLFGGKGCDGAGEQGYLNDLWKYDPALNQWAWLKGANTINQEGTYGSPGVSAPNNTPGARVDAVSWRTTDGALYLFGGLGRDGAGLEGNLNDLWKYDPATNQWTWLKGANTRDPNGAYGTRGTPASANTPGGRLCGASWSAADGALYLLGGFGYGAPAAFGHLNDLWRYNPTTNQWTWLTGANTANQGGTYGTRGVPAPDNTPGARATAAAWTGADGILFLFGGGGYDRGAFYTFLNDLWEYDTSANQWAWLAGASMMRQSGTYGTQGTPALDNTPGARWGAAAWANTTGTLHLFGGRGYDGAGTYGALNDLWALDPAANQWTWVKGASTVNQSGTYGTQGTPAPANIPGARDSAVEWRGGDGAFYLFGGSGYDGTAASGSLNDLWRYDPATNQWTWLKGAATIKQSGLYGTRGTPAPDNTPGARVGAVSWMGRDGTFYMFGGSGCDATGVSGGLNDLWRYDPPSNQWVWLKGSNTGGQKGTYGTPGTPAPANTPGARDFPASWTGADDALYLFGGAGYDGGGSGGYLNDLWRYDPVANQWTWLKGADTIDQAGTYGTRGIPAPANVPGARQSAASWTDADGALYLFGGWKYSGWWGGYYQNDLWRYDPASNQWTWLKGADTINQSGIYGTPGRPGWDNTPGARQGAVSWVGKDRGLYLFGGYSFDCGNYFTLLGDVWRFSGLPPSAARSWPLY